MTGSWTTRRFTVLAACIGALALALRLVYVAELRGTPLFAVPIGDGWQYDLWAQRIAAGDWLGSESFYQSPLYPYFLASIYRIVGHSLTVVRVVQALFGAAACVLIAVAGRHFISAGGGLAASAMLALYPFAIFSDGLIQKSSLDLFLISALLALLAAARGPAENVGTGGAPSRKSLAGAGVVLALLTLNRETTRILYPVIAWWLLVHLRRSQPLRARASSLAVFTIAVALVILPVGLRNYIVSGEFLLSTWQLGPNFFIGNNPAARGYYEPLASGGGSAEREREDATRLAETAVGRPLSASEISSYWLSRSIEFSRREPLAWLRQLGVKSVLAFNAREISDSESIEAYEEFSTVLRSLRWFTFGIVMPLAAAGAWLTRRNWRALALLYVMFFALVFSVVLFYVFARYRYPIVPIALIFAGAAAVEIPGMFRKSARSWSPLLLAVIAVAVFSHAPVASNLADTTFFNVGVGLVKMGQHAQGVRLLEKAVERAPDDAAAYYELGGALGAIGERTRAAHAFEATVRLRPDDWEAHVALGLTLRDLGRVHEAAEHFGHAVRLKPNEAVARKNLGVALYELGEDHKAITELLEAVRLRPDDVAARYTLAQLHARAGRGVETLQALEGALAAARKSGVQEDISRIEEAIRLTKAQMAGR